MRSNAEERVNVEVAMREKGHGWILRELLGDRQAKVNDQGMRWTLTLSK
jgi:pre-mRNA-splicing helicase BRR2